MIKLFVLGIILLSGMATLPRQCANAEPKNINVQQKEKHNESSYQDLIQQEGNSINTRIKTPPGFERTPCVENSFQAYLRHQRLKPHGAKVRLYSGNLKSNQNVHLAVLDLDIGTKNLHQCADAIMRLRAEYLWHNKAYDKIHFNFTNGFRVDYNEWMKGKRIEVRGNDTRWKMKTHPSTSYSSFWKYLETIFTYAGTLSLSKELKSVAPDDLDIGDVFIQGGAPGHAVIVMDRAIHPDTGQVLFLLAQSYMPAQEIHLLQNPNDPDLSPWYAMPGTSQVVTPEWNFMLSDLKRFYD